ncbi:MAG TPA: hypothetical protein VI796_04930 [Candidatus Thermoplasmatota archaeon]|nr:hypothetical protein [Candidatus Thermoplasmatota archaeon]
MNTKTIRGLLLTAFLLNVGFLALVIADYVRWDGDYAVPIFVAWAVVIFISVMVGLFATTTERTVVHEVERVVGRPLASTARVVEFHEAPRAASTSAPAPSKPGGPFHFNGYTLHSRQVTLKGGGERPIYFFAKSKPKSGHPIPKPDGFHVGVNERTGLPFLKRGSGADGEDLTPEAEHHYRPQCAALTEDGEQCRSSARSDSRYCISHKGYQPPTAKGIVMRADTASKVAARDTKPGFAGDMVNMTEKGSQCQALTASGSQCRNTVIAGSQYCVSHKGYRAPTPAAVVRGKDTKPRVRKAKDTVIAVRRVKRQR